MANELARHGVRPRIIDRGSAPATTSRALVVQPRTLEIFADIGVIDQAIAAGEPASSLTITFAKKTVEMDFAGQLIGPQNYTAYPEARTLSQHDTERILTDLLSKQGVEIELGPCADGSDPGRRCGARFVAWRGWIDRDRQVPVGHRLRRCAQRGTQGDRHPVRRIDVPRRIHHGRCRNRLDIAARRTIRISQSCRNFRGVLNAWREPLPDLRQLPPGPDGPGAEYSEPTHEEFQAMVDERVPFPPRSSRSTG